VDFDNDSLIDLVSGDRSGYVNYFHRLPNGTLTTEPRVQANGSEIYDPLNSAPNLVDWNEDGLLDLLLANSDQSPRRIRLYLNSGTPEQYVFTNYTELTAGSAPIELSRMNPHVVDLDGDGMKDLICGEDYGSIYYYENTGTNETPVLASGIKLEAEGVPIQFPSGYTDLKVWADDWNEDGTPDLVVGNYEDSVHLFIAYPLTGAAEVGRAVLGMMGVAPNPLTERVTVRYSLARPAQVNVSVYDAQGRQVSVLENRSQEAGTHSTVWAGRSGDGGRVRPGAYFVRLSACGRTSTHRITVAR
jgi:hypothetical protein